MSFTGAPKCKNCSKTAYSQESITYDKETYHKRCFRCTKCDSVVSLGKVAMIQGDLYCKNCFLRMFSEKGTYHVFGTKTLPKHLLDKSRTDSPRDSSPSVDGNDNSRTSTPVESKPAASASASASPAPEEAPAIERRSSAASNGTGSRITLTVPAKDTTETSAPPSPRKQTKICVVDDCIRFRVAGKNRCEEHLKQQIQENSEPPAGVDALFAAIRAKSVNDVKEVLHQYGVQICLVAAADRKSAVQFAFGEEGSAACGEAIVETLADYLKDLQADVDMLKDQMAPEDDGKSAVVNK